MPSLRSSFTRPITVAGGPPGEGEDGGFAMYFFILCLLRYRLRGPPSGSLPVVNSVAQVARSDSGCSTYGSTSTRRTAGIVALASTRTTWTRRKARCCQLQPQQLQPDHTRSTAQAHLSAEEQPKAQLSTKEYWYCKICAWDVATTKIAQWLGTQSKEA